MIGGNSSCMNPTEVMAPLPGIVEPSARSVNNPIEELLEHASWLRRLAAQLCAGPHEADDVVQEVWQATLAAEPGQVRSPRAWLAGAVRNVVNMRRRGEGRRQRRDEQAARSGVAPSASELASEQELRKRLIENVDLLPPAERDVVLLRFWRELPPRKVAQELKIPVNTVRSRTARALERLRTQLDEQHGDRKAWCLAMLPLLDCAALRVAGAAPSMALGAKLGVAAVAVASLGLGGYAIYSNLTAYAPLDLRQQTPPIEALASFVGEPDLLATSSSEPAAPAQRTRIAAKATSFGGSIVDRAGKAIAGAYVHREATWFYSWIRYGKIRAEDWATTSDEQGRFVLPPSAFVFRRPRTEIKIGEVTHPDYVAELNWSDWPLDANPRIVMRRSFDATLEIEVVEKGTGAPVPRFEVAFASTWGERTRLPNGGTTSSDPTWRRLVGIDGNNLREHGVDGKLQRSVRLVADASNELCIRVRGAEEIRELITAPTKHGTVVRRRFEVTFDAAAKQAGNRLLRGVVVDALTDKPIPGAFMTLRLKPQVAVPANPTRRLRTTARADGAFAFGHEASWSPAGIDVVHPDYCRQVFPYSGDSRELRLRVLPLPSLTVNVQDRGRAAAGLHVLLHHRPVGRGSSQQRAITDEHGNASFVGLPIDTVGIYIVAGPMDPDEEAIDSASVSLKPGEARTYTFDLDAPDRVHLTGKVAAGPDVKPHMLPIFVPITGEQGWVRSRPSGAAGYDAGGLHRGKYLTLLVPSTDDHRDGPFAFGGVIEVASSIAQVHDFLLPTGTVRGQVAGIELGGEPVQVVAVPKLIGESLGTRQFLASNRITKLFGKPLAQSGMFELPRIADGDWVLELRQGGEVLARRDVTVANGGLDIGLWTVK